MIKGGASGVRERLIDENLKVKIKTMLQKLTTLKEREDKRNVAKVKRQPSKRHGLKGVLPTFIEKDHSDDDDFKVKSSKSPYISYNNEDSVVLTSPTFGDKIKVFKPQVRFGSSI